jgi:menaquinone-specific isochorismate synthase
VYHIVSEDEVGTSKNFTDNVSRALDRIHSGAYEKIVIARALDLGFDNPCQPLKILNRLRQDYSSCSAFSLQNEEGTSFIGATPERLVSAGEGRFETEALAGSTGRSGSAAVDALLAREMLTSEKELREHRHVVTSIERRLNDLGLSVNTAENPGLLVLQNVQHLRTPISGHLPEQMHLLDLVEGLHPTPALGGTPREAALPDIREWEPFPRGLFGGLVGWIDCRGRGELAVGIRSAMVRGSKARLYAGAGIVEGSNPEQEFRETSLKMEALLSCIRGITS